MFIKLLLKDILYKRKYPLKIYDTKQSLTHLIENNCSISRFGDGEINLILGKSLSFQSYNMHLSNRLQSILKVQNPVDRHIVAVPYVWTSYKGYSWKSIKYWMIYLIHNRPQIYELLNFNYHYYDAQITRIYINRANKKMCSQYFRMWKEIWKNKDVLIIEGEYSRFGVGNDLLDSAKGIKRILCPAKEAYDYYNEIQENAVRYSKNKLILILLGPTATVLAYDLAKIGKLAIDLGHLDMEYEWYNRHVKEKVKIEGKYTNEIMGGDVVSETNDEKYANEIIMRIGC